MNFMSKKLLADGLCRPMFTIGNTKIDILRERSDVAGYNKTFELTIDDLALIEGALHRKKTELSLKRLDAIAGTVDAEPEEIDTELRDIHGLLGRLHNQKVFYRPKSGVYVGG